jgi:hypothetical protein
LVNCRRSRFISSFFRYNGIQTAQSLEGAKDFELVYA